MKLVLSLVLASTIIDKIFEANSSFHVKLAHYGKSLISAFHEIFACTDKILILGRGLSTRQQFYEILIFS